MRYYSQYVWPVCLMKTEKQRQDKDAGAVCCFSALVNPHLVNLQWKRIAFNELVGA